MHFFMSTHRGLNNTTYRSSSCFDNSLHVLQRLLGLSLDSSGDLHT